MRILKISSFCLSPKKKTCPLFQSEIENSIQFSHTSYRSNRVFFCFFYLVSLYCKTDWQCYFVPEALCHFQTYRSNVDALSHAVSAEGLLPLAWQGLLVALGLIAISATFVPSLTAIALWPNDNIKSQCTGRAWLGTMNRRLEIVMITVSARALQTSQVSCENAAVPKTAKP